MRAPQSARGGGGYPLQTERLLCYQSTDSGHQCSEVHQGWPRRVDLPRMLPSKFSGKVSTQILAMLLWTVVVQEGEGPPWPSPPAIPAWAEVRFSRT